MEAIRSPLTCTVTDMAALLGISRSKAYACVRTGEIPAIHIGRRLVVPMRVVDELLRPPIGGPLPTAAVGPLDSAPAPEPAAQGDQGGVHLADPVDGGAGKTDPSENADQLSLFDPDRVPHVGVGDVQHGQFGDPDSANPGGSPC